MDSLGYRQWRKYIEGEKTKEEAVEDWKREEKKYAKRQLTWFRRDSRINWFDITEENYQKRVEELVKKWYITNNTNEHK
ncbi:MAG: tRNA dimethylallyltransferase [Candidatus Woesebacteria bacterium GW2011_GWB1_40_101]|nr:MAG: tRNA dimethylallyltransferase [Candidatus Woesebacteria bacterium GW2011_GWB1_40_101]